MNNQYSISETVTIIAVLITPLVEGQGGGQYV